VIDASSVKRILLIRTDRIGDVVLSMPMLPELRKHFPSAKITMMVRPYTEELVKNHPDVNDVMLWNENDQKSIVQMVSRLTERHFDIAILPYPRFNLALMIFLARIQFRVGTGYRWYSFLLNKKVYEHRKDARKHEVEYNLDLLRAIGIDKVGIPHFDFEISDVAMKKVDSMLEDDDVTEKGFIILHAGSGGSARDWPMEKFSQLGNVIQSELQMKVVLTGGLNEIHLVGSVEHQMKTKPLNYTGKFSLQELGALCKRAAVFVSNSTGPLHIASIVGTPVIAFYPPIIQCSPARWGPYTEKKIVFTSDSKKCDLCNGGMCQSNSCMNQITVEDVLSSIKIFLKERA
jgi:heptosyltransferase III